MDTKTWVALAIALLIIIFGARYWASQSQPATTDATATTTAATTTDTAAPATKPTTRPATKPTQTYASLITQQGSYECDYSQVSSSSQSRNVIYLEGGKMRAEFRTISGNVTEANLAVYDGRYLYSWDEGASVGKKTAVTALSQLPAAIPTDLTSGKIYGQTYQSVGWKCHPWIKNASLLVPPSYVSFR